MELNFPIPYQTPLYRSKPSRYISHLVGHEGQGSIFYFLQRRGLATALSCGQHSAGRGLSLLNINVSLTKTGLREALYHPLFGLTLTLLTDAYRKVLSVIFQYFHLLEKSLEDTYHFDETKHMETIGFNHAEKYSSQQYTKNLSQAMNNGYEREHIISEGVFDWQLDEGHIRDIIASLTVENSRAFIAAKSFEGIAENIKWEKEKWYGTEYAQRSLISTDFSVIVFLS